MTYYVFKITPPEGKNLVKNLTLLDDFESFREAKNYAKQQRVELNKLEVSQIKVMLADNQPAAEAQLMAYRKPQILMEHEK